MEARIYNEDGSIDRYPVEMPEWAKQVCRAILAIEPGAYEADLYDAQFDRVLWRSGDKRVEPFVGQTMFEGVQA